MERTEEQLLLVGASGPSSPHLLQQAVVEVVEEPDASDGTPQRKRNQPGQMRTSAASCYTPGSSKASPQHKKPPPPQQQQPAQNATVAQQAAPELASEGSSCSQATEAVLHEPARKRHHSTLQRVHGGCTSSTAAGAEAGIDDSDTNVSLGEYLACVAP